MKINSGNPNLVSVPVTSVSMSTKEGVISVGRVTHVDLGYTVLSMLVKNGPNIAIKYEKLARVNFINNKGTVKVFMLLALALYVDINYPLIYVAFS